MYLTTKVWCPPEDREEPAAETGETPSASSTRERAVAKSGSDLESTLAALLLKKMQTLYIACKC